VWYRANDVAAAVRRFSVPAVFHNPDFPEYDLSLRGTAFKCTYDGKYLVLVTSHQTRDFDFDQFVVEAHEAGYVISSGACTFSKDVSGSEEHVDVRLYDFSEPVASGALRADGWFRLPYSLGDQGRVDPAVVFCLGFPTCRTVVDYESRAASVGPYALFGRPCTSYMERRFAFAPIGPMEFEPTGLSGSPVFGIIVSAFGAELVFLGLATNASKAKLHFATRSDIFPLIQSAFNGIERSTV
jgi:hypothetical protein